MRIDLHCHTKKTKKGDGAARNVTPALFKKKIELAEVKIVAITNHNAFDYDQYKLLRETVDGSSQVWPGVEIDVVGETKFHLIVITKAEDAKRFATQVKILFYDKNVDTWSCSMEDVCSAFIDFDAIFVPHFHDKKPAISENDRNKLITLVGDTSRVFIEPRNHRTLGVLANKDLSVLIGSDVKDWNKYEDCTFAELRLPVGSYTEFLMLARRETSVVKTLLNKKTPVDMIGRPHESVSLALRLYPDINIIFGPKGTGKSEILTSLYSEMLSTGKRCKIYRASERSDEFSSLLSLKDMDLDLGKVHASACEKEFSFLSNWSDYNPTLFTSYLNWHKTKGNSNNKNRMKITEAVHDNFSKGKKYEIHKNDKKKVDSVLEELRSVQLKDYLPEDEANYLLLLLDKLSDCISEKRIEDLILEYSSMLINKCIDRIKLLADRSSDTVSRPSTAGLKDFVQRRIKLLHAVNTILRNLAVPEFNEQVKIGSLEGKGNIYINYKYRMICPGERTANFPNYNITVLRNLKSKLEYLREHFFEEDIASHLESFNHECIQSAINSIKPFLGRSKQILSEDGSEYTPSNGEKGILLLQRALHEDADAYFLDEPELGMGNSYINNDIRPIISNLAKQRKFVVVATHNANIAVRTLPYLSIYRRHENGVYQTYLGNPFDDRLVNIDDPDNVKSWTEESLHSLEGGHEAFYERRDIYESRDN